MRYEHLPAFGPTEVSGDDDIEAVAIVRVAYALSREQLIAALSYGFPEIADGREPADLTDTEVRAEVEGYLGARGIVGLQWIVEHEGRRTHPPEQQALHDALAAAVDRTYLTPRPAPAMQSPRYREGTVTLQTTDHGEVTVPEPAWCTGHDDEYVGYLADVTHNGRHARATAVTEEHGTVDVLDAHISHAPHAVAKPEPYPVVSVVMDVARELAPADGPPLVHALRLASIRLERLLAEAEHLRGEGQ